MTIVFSVGRPGGQNLAAFHKAGKRTIVHTMVPIIPTSGPIIYTFESAIIICVWRDLRPAGKSLECVWGVPGCCLMRAVTRQKSLGRAWNMYLGCIWLLSDVG